MAHLWDTSATKPTMPFVEERIAEVLEQKRALFWEEADKHNVLPLLGGMTSFFGVIPSVP